jgi:hypothetical protein
MFIARAALEEYRPGLMYHGQAGLQGAGPA